MYETLQLMYHYNSWAMSQLLQVLSKVTPADYDAPGCSGNGSIRQTLAHLLTTQLGWFSWFDKSMTIQQSLSVRISPEEIASVAVASARWREIDEKTKKCIESLSEEKARAVWPVNLPSGRSFSLPLWKMMLHVANHGTHTRAQIVAAVRRLGVDPGSYDMVNYLLNFGG